MDSNLKLLTNDSSELVDVTHYKQIIGSLMYLSNTRPDICFAVNTLIQYLVQPRRVHLVATKHVMRYLKGTIDFGLYYDNIHEYKLYDYTCNVPNPSTGEEDATMALTIWAIGPMNMCIHKILKQNALK